MLDAIVYIKGFNQIGVTCHKSVNLCTPGQILASGLSSKTEKMTFGAPGVELTMRWGCRRGSGFVYLFFATPHGPFN